MKFLSFGVCLLIGLLLTPSENSITGKWIGVTENQPLLGLVIKNDDRKISGSIEFSKIRGGQTEPLRKEEVSIINPKFDGENLVFDIKRPDGEVLKMSMTLTTKKQAVLTLLDGRGQDIPIKMEKIQ